MARRSTVSKEEFDQLVNDVQSDPSLKQEHPHIFAQIEAVIKAVEDRHDSVTVSDVRRLARLRLQMILAIQLELRAKQIVDKIKDIAPDRNSTLLSMIDSIDKFPDEKKRAYVIELQDLRVELSINAEYGAIRRFQLLSDVAAAGAITLLLLVAAFMVFAGFGTYPVAAVALVAAWGSLGAVVSLTTRVRDLSVNDLSRQAQLFQGRDWSLMLGPVFGGIGSVIVVVAVTAGVVSSSLVSAQQLNEFWVVPAELRQLTTGGWEAKKLTVISGKLFAVNAATLVLYLIALVAGRSERVVVDSLDLVESKLVKRK